MLETLTFTGLIGIYNAMFLWLIAAGLTLAFGVLGVLNFAHGSLYMLGAYIAFYFFNDCSFFPSGFCLGLGWNFFLSVALGIAGVAIISLVTERFFFRPIYHLEVPYQIILTYGFILIFSDAVRMIFGGTAMIPQMPEFFEGGVRIGLFRFPYFNFFVIFVGIAVAIGLWLLLERTSWGKTVRAAASDREMASALGVNIPLLFTLVFATAGALAALGGALGIPAKDVNPGVGTQIIVDAFIITVIGGLGSLQGAFLGAVILGLLNSYGALFFPEAYVFLKYLLMASVLLVRPKGLLGGA